MALSARLCFEGLLTECSKVGAPSMLLLDFNYMFNKAINLYVNKKYNIYDTNQLSTDDLRVLKTTQLLKPEASVYTDAKGKELEIDGIKLSNIKAGNGEAKIFGAIAEVELPLDYLHALNCICIYKVNKTHKCYDKGDYVQFAAKRLTSDTWSTVINDFYTRPLPERPYYFIHNYNKQSELPTNEYDIVLIDSKNILLNGTDQNVYTTVSTSLEQLDGIAGPIDTSNEKKVKSDSTINLISLVNKSNDGYIASDPRNKLAGNRLGNSSRVRMEIRYGMNDVFELVGVLVDYIKVPQTIRLTQEQVNLTEDTSQIMEFPDYVCLEIINELVLLVMENTADPRMQTHNAVTQSIAPPVQQLTTPVATRKTNS